MNAESMPVQNSAQQTGILETVQNKVNASGALDTIRNSKDLIFESAIYLGIGFLSGFLFKKYSSYIVAIMLVFVGLGVLNYMQMIHISIDWAQVSSATGLTVAQPVTTDNFFSVVIAFVKANKVVSASGIVGFLIGLKIG